MDTTQLTALIVALTVLVGTIDRILQRYFPPRILKEIHTQTNSLNTALVAKADLATEQRATAVELAARPDLPSRN